MPATKCLGNVLMGDEVHARAVVDSGYVALLPGMLANRRLRVSA